LAPFSTTGTNCAVCQHIPSSVTPREHHFWSKPPASKLPTRASILLMTSFVACPAKISARDTSQRFRASTQPIWTKTLHTIRIISTPGWLGLQELPPTNSEIQYALIGPPTLFWRKLLSCICTEDPRIHRWLSCVHT
jgi:hypothetical protein